MASAGTHHANCPQGYVCALAEVCTRRCEQTGDCWVGVEQGCRSGHFAGEVLPDGAVYQDDVTEDGICPETKLMVCIAGHCQRFECADGGCDYDVYGPSEIKGNRDQGP